MNRKLGVLALFTLAFTICLGAFGAHALKEMVDVSAQQSFETGVRYQFYGSILQLVLSFRPEFSSNRFALWLRLFVVGMWLFSGSIYGLVLGKMMDLQVSFLGPITPVGGILMIFSLMMIALLFQRNPPQE
ncbi:MAG: DUF423 domain-containing protein [Bacteroidetes bacterium]|nr:DUF423 domain-containing protein [Bacteroidota bacterium]